MISDESDNEDQPLSDQWWAKHMTKEDQFKIELSGKLVVLGELLKMCAAIGDKM